MKRLPQGGANTQFDLTDPGVQVFLLTLCLQKPEYG